MNNNQYEEYLINFSVINNNQYEEYQYSDINFSTLAWHGLVTLTYLKIVNL